MKKKNAEKRWLMRGLLLVCIFLTGCGTGRSDEERTEGSFQAESLEQMPDTQYDSEELLQNNAFGRKLVQTVGEQDAKYAYSCLPEEKKQIYLEILYILQGFYQDIEVSSVEEEDLAYVFQCVMNDHPELFYVDGYTFTKYTIGDKVTKITLSGTYTMTQEEAAQRLVQIERKVESCLADVPPNADEYEKVKYVYEYLIRNTSYNVEAQENQTICSVFLYGESVCQGYAKAMQYLLEKLQVSATLVSGYVENGDGHAWNLVQIDGAYYYVDPTWGDAYYKLDQNYQDPAQHLPDVNYDYLCVTTQQLMATHAIDNIVPVPRCVQTENNYYVREGAYFAECDETKIQMLFERAYLQGQESVTMKCSDSAVYAQLKKLLLEEQQVFEYLKEAQGRVAYTDNDVQMTISFWL